MRILLTCLCATVLAAADGAPPRSFALAVGQPFAWAPRFGGNPTSFSAEGLPPGLTIDAATGAVGGTPTASGTWTLVVTARNKAGSGTSRARVVVAPGRAVAPPLPAAQAEEEDEVDPSLAAGVKLHPWTEYQRRSTWNYFLPAATTLLPGEFYYRISHVSRESYYDDWRTNLLGLDDNVKIGLMLAYGIRENLDVSLQRVNGYDLQVEPQSEEKPTSFDYYDLLLKWKAMDEVRSGLADVALVVGATHMLRNGGAGDTSLNAQLVIERDLLQDRLRLGTGLVHAGLSAHERTLGTGSQSKLFPAEYDHLTSLGAQPDEEDAASTTAIPVTVKIALGERWALLGEVIQPIAGWRTGIAPAMAAGMRYNTHTHEFSFLVTNTANASFNSVITGGDQDRNLNLFAFTISAFL